MLAVHCTNRPLYQLFNGIEEVPTLEVHRVSHYLIDGTNDKGQNAKGKNHSSSLVREDENMHHAG
jgi:hypothetical protein